MEYTLKIKSAKVVNANLEDSVEKLIYVDYAYELNKEGETAIANATALINERDFSEKVNPDNLVKEKILELLSETIDFEALHSQFLLNEIEQQDKVEPEEIIVTFED